MTKLKERRVPVGDACQVCGVAAESISHCLIWCNYARACWSIVGLGTVGINDSSFEKWFEEILNNHKEKVDLTAMICWGIWKARNDLVWNNRTTRAGMVVFIANAYLSQWKNVQIIGSSGLSSSAATTGECERWAKPVGNCVKVNCDAATFNAYKKFGVGWLARDNEGVLIAAKASLYPGVVGAQCAEAIGVREALSWILQEQERGAALEYDQQNAYILESDCQLIVQAIKDAKPILSPVGVVISDCLTLVRKLKNISIQFVKRSGNKATDFLASLACFNLGGIARGAFVPTELQAI